MRKPLEFRFTLSHPIEGVVQIDEPIGWDKSAFTLKRDDKYKAITFEYSSSLTFFRANSRYNGGGEFILFILNKYGPDEGIILTVEISDHNRPFEVVFTGRLNLESLTETERGVECIAEQEDFFTIFNQRTGLQVSFKDNQSVDGFALQAYEPYTLNMHSKVLIKRTEAEIKQELPFPEIQTHEFTINAGLPGFPDPNKTGFEDQPDTEFITRTSYIQFDFSSPSADELKDYWKVAGNTLAVVPPPIYTAAESGLHSFDFNILTDIMTTVYKTGTFDTYVTCHEFDTGYLELIKVKFVFRITDIDGNEKYLQEISIPDANFCGDDEATLEANAPFAPLNEFNLDVDDSVYLYAEVINEATYARLVNVNANLAVSVGHLLKEGSYLKIIGKTFTEPSTAPAMRIHDVFANLCNKLTNRNNAFYSEDFGYIGSPYHSYTQNGVYADFAIQNGFNIRNFPWSDRPLQLDFTTLFDSLDAIFGLSLNLEVIDGLPTIRVERISYAYSTDVALTLNHVNKMKRSIDKSRFYNEIQVGYEYSLPKDINGLDEHATRHVYTTALKTIGSTLVLISKVIASGSLIEVTRRLQFNATLTTDSEYDNHLFIIALNHSDPTVPETNEYYDQVNNLLSPETAYNLRLWPAFNLLRNGNRINGGLLKKLGSQYKFQSGEGNYIIEMEMKESEIIYPGSYNAELLAGGTNINWAYADLPEVTPLWTCDVYEFKYPFSVRSFNLLKANRNKSIRINGDLTSEYISVVVLEVSSEVVDGMGTFKGLCNSVLPFNYVPEDADHLLLQDGFYLLMEDDSLILL